MPRRARTTFAAKTARTAVMIAAFAATAPALAARMRVAIYAGTGAASDKILAMFRAVEASGNTPLAIVKSDIVHGRLTPQNFPVFIIPSGEDGKKCCAGHYSDIDSLDQVATKDAIRAYLNAGGGIVAEEAGAYYASSNGGNLDIYAGSFTATSPAAGLATLTLTDAAFGTGNQSAYVSTGGGYFSLASGATQIAKDAANHAVIVRAPYGAGRVVLGAASLELRGDTEIDWTIWDNWAAGGVHPSSAGAWTLLSRMIAWAGTGSAAAPALVPLVNAAGHRIAVIATHTNDGGAWPGLLPGVARAIDWSGHVPLAIRFDDVAAGRLVTSDFKVVTMPGGYSYGYKLGFAGQEPKIRDFIASGGSYYGICAGSFYAAYNMEWLGRSYDYPLAIYQGRDIGPIDDISPWPTYALTPLDVTADPVLGNLGTLRQLYYGGGYHEIPTDQAQGAHVTTSATFAYTGSAHNRPAVVRYAYGAGRVLLVTTHPESRSGSDEDWMYWDGYADDSTTPIVNPDNPWVFVKAAFDNWLSGPPPPPSCSGPPDADADGRSDACDCAPGDPGAFAIPGEVGGLALAANRTTLTWSSLAASAGAGTSYQVLRGSLAELPAGNGPSETCLPPAPGTTATDPASPAAGDGFWYLVRARDVCGVGGYGATSAGAPQTSSACP